MKILSLDLGASKCDINLGTCINDKIEINKIGEFNNYLIKNNNGYLWDIGKIIKNIKYFINKCLDENGPIDYFVNCSWGLDYIMFDSNNNIIYPCYSYRNIRTTKYFEENNFYLKEKGINNSKNLTYYQIKSEEKTRLKKCKFILSISDSINFILCQKKYWNMTIASTTGLLDMTTNNFDIKILNELCIKNKIPELSNYGQIIGEYEGIKIINGLSHDTASAIYSLKIKEDEEVYIICGTWCIIGILTNRIQTHNIGFFTNESGYKNIRFLKNVIGLWLIQRLSKLKNLSYEDLDKYAESYSKKIEGISFKHFDLLESKNNITKTLKKMCQTQDIYYDDNIGLFVKLIYISLIKEIKNSIKELELIKNIKIKKINILGGGCKSDIFMNLLSKSFKIPVSIHSNLNSSMGNIFFIKDVLKI